MSTSFGTYASRAIIHTLERHGFEAVFVGGAVRDFLLGKAAHDIDIATAAEPLEVKALFSNTVDIGIDHGTVLVIEQNEPVEVTTFRTEGTYTDHRRPDSVQFVKSLREDLLRRDFTINAIAIRSNGELVDYFGGQEDLQRKRIKCVGNALERFEEDALRMLRAVRFSSVLQFEIDQDTIYAMQTVAPLLRNVSIERIKIELDKLFLGKSPNLAFDYIEESKLAIVLPYYPSRKACRQYLQRFESSLEGWAFWMIGSKSTAQKIAKAYKLSNDEASFLQSVEQAFKIRQQRTYSTMDIYTFSAAVLRATERIFQACYQSNAENILEELVERKDHLPIQSSRDLAIDGRMLMDWIGRRGGRWTGEALRAIEVAVVNGDCENELTDIKNWFIHEYFPQIQDDTKD